MILFAKDLKPSQKVLLLQIEAIAGESGELVLPELAQKLGIRIQTLRERMLRLQQKGYLVRQELPRKVRLELKPPSGRVHRSRIRSETPKEEHKTSAEQAQTLQKALTGSGSEGVAPATLNGNVSNVNGDIYKQNVNVESSPTGPQEGTITSRARLFVTMIRDSGDNLNFWKQMVRKLGYETLCGYYGRAHTKRREIKNLPAYIISLLKAEHPELFSHS